MEESLIKTLVVKRNKILGTATQGDDHGDNYDDPGYVSDHTD